MNTAYLLSAHSATGFQKIMQQGILSQKVKYVCFELNENGRKCEAFRLRASN